MADPAHPQRDAKSAGVVVIPVEERFLSKVDRSGDCWLWTAYIDPIGYGHFSVGSLKARRAHRIAYELFVGPIPEGLVIDHLCRVRHCVNPAHLEAVTDEENRNRGLLSPIRTHCNHGHEFTAENSYITPPTATRPGRRSCRECKRAHDKKRRSAA